MLASSQPYLQVLTTPERLWEWQERPSIADREAALVVRGIALRASCYRPRSHLPHGWGESLLRLLSRAS